MLNIFKLFLFIINQYNYINFYQFIKIFLSLKLRQIENNVLFSIIDQFNLSVLTLKSFTITIYII